MTASASPDLYDLAQRVGRLRPSWEHPERFFEDRSELAHELRRLARQGIPEAAAAPPGPTARGNDTSPPWSAPTRRKTPACAASWPSPSARDDDGERLTSGS
jgi:hypothetical protein